MRRQTFISKEFFVNASENDAQQVILNLPSYISNIKLIAHNHKLHSVSFAYEREPELMHQVITVAVLPLNNQQTQVTLHGSYASGVAFSNDPYVENAVANFENAIHAALQGSLATFEPLMLKKSMMQKFMGFVSAITTNSSTNYTLKKA